MSETRRGIIAAGHWIVDHVKRIDTWPEPATLARIEHQQMANGGFAFNLLADLAALDPACPLHAGGLVGEDGNGGFVREQCRRLKLDTARLQSSAEFPTSYTDVMTETGSGRRTFFHSPGANEHLSEAHLRLLLQIPARIFCLGYLGFLPALDALAPDGTNGAARLLQSARTAGMLTAADLVSARNPRLREQVLPCLPQLDLLFLNEWEAGQLLGQDVRAPVSFHQAMELAKSVRRLGVRGTVALHFPEGVVAVGEKECLTQGSVQLPAQEIQGTVGAGDALAAGVLLGRHQAMSWPESLKLGVCAAAACLTAPTASDGLKPWKQCLELGSEFGFKSLV
jgi:sugar/nucleoside kinase (ribokinase family)